MSGILGGIADAVSNAADTVADKAAETAEAVADKAEAVVDKAKDGLAEAAFNIAEKEIKENYGYDIDIEAKDIPASWMEWVMKTGVNSLCTKQSWTFLHHDRKKALFEERGIKKIIVTVDENPDEDISSWATSDVKWEAGDNFCTLVWYPRAQRWESDNNWLSSGYKRWWNLCDELVFGLQLYQLEGECFYKSDWLDGVEDPVEGPIPRTEKVKRWFQFRHWIIYWYKTPRSGWNWERTKNPPPMADGSDFNLDSVLSLPGMPDFEMPKISLPSLPDVSMPSLPDAPSISAPSLSAPSLSAPDLSNVSMPSIPEAPKRPKGKWAAHGFIQLDGLNVIAKGNKVIFSDAKITHFWQDGNGYRIKDELKEHSRMELEAVNEIQAKSWVESLVASGAKEGEVTGCCCTVA